MSTSEPSPPIELASAPSSVDPLQEDSAVAPDPLGLSSAAEPEPGPADVPSSEAASDPLSKPAGKREPALADSSIFDVSEAESLAFKAPAVEAPAVEATAVAAPEIEAPVVEAPAVEAPVVEAPAVEAPVVEASPSEAWSIETPEIEEAPIEVSASESSSSDEEPSVAEDLLEEKSELAEFGDLSAFDGLSSKAKSVDPIVKSRAPLPPLVPAAPEEPAVVLSDGAGVEDDDDDDEGEWELRTGEVSTLPNDEVTEAIAKPVDTDGPWRDLDDEDDQEEEDEDDLTGVVAKEEASGQAAETKRAFRDVDDLEDDEDDPSEHLPTRVLGVPAPALGQRTVVPPPPSRGAAGARGTAPLSLPAIPPPPTLPRSVPPSVPPVAFDWILPRVGKRAGSLTVLLGGLLLLVVGVVPLVVIGAWVAGKFSSPQGSLVVTVAGANHGPVDSPVVITDDVPRCKESPCKVTGLEPGTHFVRVTAPGYQPMAPRAVAVEKGGEVVLHVELAREPSRVTVADSTPAKTQAPLDLDAESVKADALPRAGKAGTVAESLHASTAVASRAATAPASVESGRLNLSSSPPSSVVLDGRPLGVTPRSAIKVKPGPHSVVFIHPKLGRKSARANVKPGGTSNVSVRFR
jgi:hypothetical protein